MKVKTRFAPSPTGNLHIGSIRTALYSWLFAKKHNGEFILRIEDTDVERSQKYSIDSILNGLKWLGLNWDKGPYFQTKRLNRYKKVIAIMLKKGDAYKCVCSHKKLEKEREEQIRKGIKPRYSGTCRNLNFSSVLNHDYVIRFKNPVSGKVKFNDQIRGEIVFENRELDDLIIQRSNGMPTYNFCVVIDDLDMNITHVIRGEDHINNTPRQINIFKSLGAKIPIYAHLSMILDEVGNKISKRKNAQNIMEYQKNGFLPEALLNYIVRLGWSYGNQEIFSISDMKKLFDLTSMSKSASIINIKKLLWINKYYISNLSLKKITDILRNYMKEENVDIKNSPNLEFLVKSLRNRFYTIQEMATSFRCFYEEFKIFCNSETKKYLVLSNCSILEKSYKKIKKLSIWNSSIISNMIDHLSIETNIQKIKINMILRVAVVGVVHSPSISLMIYLLGQKQVLLRIQKTLDCIKKLNLKK
ncbi:glutamate--tRNA ligase [Buchnera aphidicola (Diuraphis noxia)]|uniref:Glutamate--tRNA ligase n=1 Tax=Buchnera aphidicola subsp. Diuraphis noxia TaxID=118101 RepID=A0A1B2H8B4_BUCDN|nr:glutamate--tRNA ligase [Buchnera aphidicola]ANZ22316.1 glutamate--tRNA ligase [Buchnera aphidicola (Diuraphis noxia)]